MSALRISLVQTDLAWEDHAANRENITKKIAVLAGQTDLIVLPEMFTTGFSMQPQKLAEPNDGPTLAWLREQAATLGAAITGSYIVGNGENYYNRLAWVTPEGVASFYDKKHLFTLAGEHEHYTPGTERLIVEYRGWRICPLICYDLRFPVWSRNTEGYDLLIYVANWPKPRRQAWRQLLAARAVENQSYTVGVNRVGIDGYEMIYTGDCTLTDYAGEQLFHSAHLEGIFTATLSLEKQQTFRKKLAFLEDRDAFTLHPSS